jgi:hypothetical protein
MSEPKAGNCLSIGKSKYSAGAKDRTPEMLDYRHHQLRYEGKGTWLGYYR